MKIRSSMSVKPHCRLYCFPSARLPAALIRLYHLKPPEIQLTTRRQPPSSLPIRQSRSEDRRSRRTLPPSWTAQATAEARTGDGGRAIPRNRVETANAAARVQPREEGYINAVQVYPFQSGRALSGLCRAGADHRCRACRKASSSSAPGRSPPAIPCAGSSAIPKAEPAPPNASISWSSRPGLIVTNLVINTDRRTYLLELRSA